MITQQECMDYPNTMLQRNWLRIWITCSDRSYEQRRKAKASHGKEERMRIIQIKKRFYRWCEETIELLKMR